MRSPTDSEIRKSKWRVIRANIWVLARPILALIASAIIIKQIIKPSWSIYVYRFIINLF